MMEVENFSGPINLGNPSEISILDLASEIIDLTGSNSKIMYEDLPVDDPQMRCPDISLANKKLGWSPKFDRKTGLKKTIKYFESLFKNVLVVQQCVHQLKGIKIVIVHFKALNNHTGIMPQKVAVVGSAFLA